MIFVGMILLNYGVFISLKQAGNKASRLLVETACPQFRVVAVEWHLAWYSRHNLAAQRRTIAVLVRARFLLVPYEYP
jgi:hypothetical protein